MAEINVPGSSTLVADVDCTAAGKPICDSNGVKGFPTVKFGDPSALEDYQGGRELDDLMKFAKSLKPSCSPANLDLCDDDAKAEINKFMDLDDAKLDELIQEKNDEVAAAEKHFETELEKLQSTYKKLSDDKDASIAAVKESGLGMMKAVKAAKAANGKEELWLSWFSSGRSEETCFDLLSEKVHRNENYNNSFLAGGSMPWYLSMSFFIVEMTYCKHWWSNYYPPFRIL